jgi:hypothetical protein
MIGITNVLILTVVAAALEASIDVNIVASKAAGTNMATAAGLDSLGALGAQNFRAAWVGGLKLDI